MVESSGEETGSGSVAGATGDEGEEERAGGDGGLAEFEGWGDAKEERDG